MIWWFAVPLLASTAVWQSTILRQVTFLDGSLDLLLVMVVCWSLLRPEEGLGWALAAGAFSDIFTGGPFGATAIAYLLTAFAVGWLHGRLRTHSPIAVMAIVLAGSALAHLAMIALLALFGRGTDIGYVLPYVTLPTAFLNTVCAVPVYLGLRGAHRFGKPALAEESE